MTDANAVLGYLDTSRRLGGAISLDVEAAKAALEPLAKRLGVSVIELALGVQRVANATMVRALARVTVERGVDGRQCTLLAFGGAGPMHAAQLAREFGITEIVVPRFSSGFSALGCIVADMSYTQQQAVRMLSTHWDADRFAGLHDGMLETLIAPLLRQGHDKAAIAVERTALVRYVGQSYAVEVPFADAARSRAPGQRLPQSPSRDLRLRHRRALGDAEPAPARPGRPPHRRSARSRRPTPCRSRPASPPAGSSPRRRTTRRATTATCCRAAR